MPLRRIALLGSGDSSATRTLKRLLTELGIATAATDYTEVDGFIVMPGGPGPLKDVLEECLGSGEKPCGLLNVGNHFSRLLQDEDDAVIEQLARETQRGRLIVDPDPAELLRAMVEYRPPETRRGSAL